VYSLILNIPGLNDAVDTVIESLVKSDCTGFVVRAFGYLTLAERKILGRM